MADTIEKLTPDRDLQCYFFEPSAVAALSSASTERLHGLGDLEAAVRLGGD